MRKTGFSISWGTTAGFTLIELLIVVVIIALLAAIGYPSYTDFVTRSRRQAAQNMLLQVADRQEQFFLDNKSYAPNLTALGYAANPIGLDPDGQLTAAGAADRTYLVSVQAATALTYTLQAVPQLVQAERDTDCATLTLNSAGVRDQSGAGNRCW